MEFIRHVFRCKHTVVRIFLAEFIGTMFLVCVVNGAAAQSVLSQGKKGEFLTANLASAFSTAFGIYISAGVSGGHINPAITLIMCIVGRCKWIYIFVYWTAQLAGAFFGSALAYGAYKDALDAFDGGRRSVIGENATAGIFASYPADYVTTGTGMFDQILGTGILSIVALAVTDPSNTAVPNHFAPLLIGLSVGLIGMSFGLNCGFPINPARDLGPRLFTLVAGWGTEVFSYRNYNWFWIPILGPLFGAVLGAFAYELFVGIHWPKDVECNRIHKKSITISAKDIQMNMNEMKKYAV